MAIIDLPPSDLARYREMFGDANISDAEKDEKIHVLVSILQSFIDAARGIDPAQLSQRTCAVESSRSARRHDTVSEAFIIHNPDVGQNPNTGFLGT